MDAVTDYKPVPVTEGPWAGWYTWGEGADPYEQLTGPYYLREEADQSVLCGFTPERKNLNGGGAVHGGALMTYADFALFAHARTWALGHYVTVQFESQFVGAGVEGVPIYSRGEVVRQTRSMLFVRGVMKQVDRTIFAFSGILKRVKTG